MTPTPEHIERAVQTWNGHQSVSQYEYDKMQRILRDHYAALATDGWQMVRWEKIENATKNEDECLVACPYDDGGYELHVATWWAQSWARYGRDNDRDRSMILLDRQPTYFMRPKPPGEGT